MKTTLTFKTPCFTVTLDGIKEHTFEDFRRTHIPTTSRRHGTAPIYDIEFESRQIDDEEEEVDVWALYHYYPYGTRFFIRYFLEETEARQHLENILCECILDCQDDMIFAHREHAELAWQNLKEDAED
jgi:hypothetical protein